MDKSVCDKSRMVTLKLILFARIIQNKNMLDLKLPFIINDGKMNECESKYLHKTNMV